MTLSAAVVAGQFQTYRYAKDMLHGAGDGVVVSVSVRNSAALHFRWQMI